MTEKIPYYVTRGEKGYWQPTKAMRDLGWKAVACGPDGPEAWAIARKWAELWKRSKTPPEGDTDPAPKPGTLAEAFQRYRHTEEWNPKKSERTREEWLRAWKHLKPFHDEKPDDVELDILSKFRAALARRISEREAHRTIKIWRALWQVAAALKYCDMDKDPSFGIRNTEPARRQAIWSDGEVARLGKRAWRMGYHGLAAAIAIAWDTSLSPVDVRKLTPEQRAKDAQGSAFLVDRSKTGRAAAGTLQSRAERVLDAYLVKLGVKIPRKAPILRNRSGRAYSKDTLGDDFRDIRLAEFGPGEKRTLADFRRSGAVEAMRGGATPEEIGNKLANDYETNTELQKTYTPVDISTVRSADAARLRGRRPGQKVNEKLETPARLPTTKFGGKRK